MATNGIGRGIVLASCCMAGLGSVRSATGQAVVTTQPFRSVGWGPLIFVWDVEHDDHRGVVGGAEFSALGCIMPPDASLPSNWILLDGNRLWLKGNPSGGPVGEPVTALTTRGQVATSRPYNPNGSHLTTETFDEWELTDYMARAYENGPSPKPKHTPFLTGDGWKRDGAVAQPGALLTRAQAYCNRMGLTLNVITVKDHPNSNRGRVVSQIPTGGYISDSPNVWVVLDEGNYIVPQGDTLSTSPLTLLASAAGTLNAAFIPDNAHVDESPSATNPPDQTVRDAMKTAQQIYWRLPAYSDGNSRRITITNAAIMDVVISVWTANGANIAAYVASAMGGYGVSVPPFTADPNTAYFVIVDALPSTATAPTAGVSYPFNQGRVAITVTSTFIPTGVISDTMELRSQTPASQPSPRQRQ